MKHRLRVMSLLRTLWLLGLLLLNQCQVDGQTNCGPRIRKDWDMLTAAEKNTYRNAVAAAMDSGAYIKFVEFHLDELSEMEAHRECMLIYWHRMMLLAFENMLRGQGPAYACVTVPYFNWIAASARMTSGACNSFEECSAIMRELGGSTRGRIRRLTINGEVTRGRCVTTPPLNRFCELSSLSGSQCAHCVPRGNWSTIRVPTATSYASVRAQIFNGANIGEMSPMIERGCHNGVHGALRGAMGTHASPSDIIFYSHHAMVDLLHVIFHKCRVGSTRLTFAQKASHPVAWTSCPRRTTGVFRPTDIITMRTGERAINPIPAATDPVIGQYFTGIPNQFAGIMDVRDLGVNSYEYHTNGQLATMYAQCDASPIARRLKEEENATNATSSPRMCKSKKRKRKRDDDDDDGDIDYASLNNFPELDFHGEDDGHMDIHIVDKGGNYLDLNASRDSYCDDEAEKNVVDWYDEALKDMGGDSHDNMIDMERQACMFEEECMGGVEDYSPEFQTIWNVTEPRCKTIVNAIKSGKETIQFKDWRKVMEARFGCPHPIDATSDADKGSETVVQDDLSTTEDDPEQSTQSTS